MDPWFPSQTWFAGKWTIEISDFPNRTSIQFGDFQLPCLITRGYTHEMDEFMK